MHDPKKRSLAIAFSHVLKHFGENISIGEIEGVLPANPDLAEILGLCITETGLYGTYPYYSPSIIRFDNGTYHYVDVPEDRTVIDSIDGISKRMDVYGTPVYWATFDFQKPTSPEPTPVKEAVYDPSAIQYEVYENTHLMHVNLPQGTKKYSFGNVKKWADIKHHGQTYELGHPIEVVALAHVPIGDETAGYFMDAHGLGKHFAETGRPAYTLGFDWTHLTDGEYEEPVKVADSIPLEPEPSSAEVPLTILEESETVISDQAIEAMAPNLWKDTYVSYKDADGIESPRSYEPVQNVFIADLEGNRASHILEKGRFYWFCGEVIKTNDEGEPVEYLVHNSTKENGYYFGVPKEYMLDEDDNYNVDLPLPVRIAQKVGYLTPYEKAWQAYCLAFGEVMKAIQRVNKLKEKK